MSAACRCPTYPTMPHIFCTPTERTRAVMERIARNSPARRDGKPKMEHRRGPLRWGGGKYQNPRHQVNGGSVGMCILISCTDGVCVIDRTQAVTFETFSPGPTGRVTRI